MRREVSLVILLFVLLFAPYYGEERILTPVNAQQNGMKHIGGKLGRGQGDNIKSFE